MRWATVDGRIALWRAGQSLDVEHASAGRFSSDVLGALGRFGELTAWATSADWSRARPVADEELGPPVPNPRQVFALALNYRPHAAEAGFEPPESPLVFTKFPSCIVGPEVEVRLPAGNVDWEIEVVVVIGSGGRDVPRANAWDAVAGLTLGQDLSERLTQSAGRPAQFSMGKSYAGFGPTGPVAVTPDEFDDRDDIAFHSLLESEGKTEQLQAGRTSAMIFRVDDLIARLSRVCELLPGDLVFTGTPEGVGNRRVPPRFLRPGEVLTSTAEGIGTIRQRFTRDSA